MIFVIPLGTLFPSLPLALDSCFRTLIGPLLGKIKSFRMRRSFLRSRLRRLYDVEDPVVHVFAPFVSDDFVEASGREHLPAIDVLAFGALHLEGREMPVSAAEIT